MTTSLYASWDAPFCPAGIGGWMTKVDAAEDGSMAVDHEEDAMWTIVFAAAHRGGLRAGSGVPIDLSWKT